MLSVSAVHSWPENGGMVVQADKNAGLVREAALLEGKCQLKAALSSALESKAEVEAALQVALLHQQRLQQEVWPAHICHALLFSAFAGLLHAPAERHKQASTQPWIIPVMLDQLSTRRCSLLLLVAFEQPASLKLVHESVRHHSLASRAEHIIVDAAKCQTSHAVSGTSMKRLIALAADRGRKQYIDSQRGRGCTASGAAAAG